VSHRGGIVLDLFGGSGSTLIAAHKTGRRARLCELDPVYCDRILQRWEVFAKDDAELIACERSSERAYDAIDERTPDTQISQNAKEVSPRPTRKRRPTSNHDRLEPRADRMSGGGALALRHSRRSDSSQG